MDTGNTKSNSAELLTQSVQPRGYGEHMAASCGISSQAGSAPWIRGTRIPKNMINTKYRFSPVDTGNTSLSSTTNTRKSVQPRGYGEHNEPMSAAISNGGSAPWIRGTR